MKPKASTWKHKDLVDIESLSLSDVKMIYDHTSSLKKAYSQNGKPFDYLKNKTVCHLFVEPSTRTKLSFEAAAQNLGASSLSLSAATSSFNKGESLRDTALNLKALQADMIVMRHPASGSAKYLSNILETPIINGGDGPHGHPTQALLDCFTILEHCNRDNLRGINVTIVGDILFSRVARSNIQLLKKIGANVTLVGPNTLVPTHFSCYDVTIFHNLQEAVADADIIISLRVQHERQTANYFPSTGEFSKMFGLNKYNKHILKKDALILHPGPINQGIELDPNVAYETNNLIMAQVENGVFVRMAVMYLCACKANIIKPAK